LFEFGLLERAALNFVEAHGVYEILRTQNPQELAHVELGDEDSLIAFENVSQI
jgi:hypothetical protein